MAKAKNRNPLALTGGKASGRIREIYTATPNVPPREVHKMLADEGLTCSIGLVTAVRRKMKTAKRKPNRRGTITFTINHIVKVKALAAEMGVFNLKTLADLLYDVEVNRTR